MRKSILFFSLAWMLTGCSHLTNTKSIPITRSNMAPKMITVSRHLSTFSSVSLHGIANVRLHTGARRSSITLHGDARDLEAVYTEVKNDTLYLYAGNKKGHFTQKKFKYSPISADIYLNTLQDFKYRGNGEIIGKNLRTYHSTFWIRNTGKTYLDGRIHLRKLVAIGPGEIEIHGIVGDYLEIDLLKNPKVELTGMAGLSKLNVRGDGVLSYYWVKSNSLTVRAKEGRSKIQLAGVVNRLDVELWGHALLNARYLRAGQTFVKTHDHATAEIVTTDRQHTLALDASDIYFYNLPVNRADFMAKNGAVLDMRDLNLQFHQEYTPYNK